MKCGASDVEELVFRSLQPVSESVQPRLIVFDFDRTLTLETHNSIINDFVSGWKGQIDPWRVLCTAEEYGWDTYGGKFAGEGLTAEELKKEFNRGKHTKRAYMQQIMQDFVRSSFNNAERKNARIQRSEFIEEELHNPDKRLHHLRRMLASIRRGLDQQNPKGQMVIMTYNSFGAIFVLNALIHAELSEFFDAIHSQINAVENSATGWKLVKPGSRFANKKGSVLALECVDVGRIRVVTAGKLDYGREGKPAAVERLYKSLGGLPSAVLVDDERDIIDAWTEMGGGHVVDLSRAPGGETEKLTLELIAKTETFLVSLLCPPLVMAEPVSPEVTDGPQVPATKPMSAAD